jgi:hypothetical protein
LFLIPMAWFEGELVLYLVYTLSYFHRIASYLPKLSIASLVILACIWLIMLVIMLGVGGHKMHIFTANIPTFYARYRR